MTSANCPSCGAPVEFQIGSSLVVICPYCRSVVARTDRGVEDLGKVAAIVDTSSPLRIGLTGKYRGVGFRLTGHTQLQPPAGGTWDEWYAAFDDGRWGWLAEAQGRYFMTFAAARASLPSVELLAVGAPVLEVDGMIVSEIGTAKGVAADGEIPWRFIPQQTYDYADLSGPSGHFATIDYSDDTPVLFLGEEAPFQALGIAGSEPRRTTHVAAKAINCERCGGALDLKLGDQAERVICPNCGAVFDNLEGRLQYLKSLRKRPHEPQIPLGSKGTIDGTAYVVAGYVRRSVRFDTTYYWDEYLLFADGHGFRWLVQSDNHWTFVTPIAAGDVSGAAGAAAEAPKSIRYAGKAYRLFQDADAKVEYVLGEFYWKVETGETVRARDYINPTETISEEVSGSGAKGEVNYSYGRYMTPAEIEKAFALKPLPRPTGVGMIQPNPMPPLGKVWMLLSAAALVLSIVLAVLSPNREVLNETVELTTSGSTPGSTGDWGTSTGATTTADPDRVVFTKPFTLSGGHNLKVEALARVENNWVAMQGDIANEKTGEVETFELPIEYYHGVDGGESWSEGSIDKSIYLAALPAGTYSMRIEAQWDPKSPPPPLHVSVREGVFHWSHFWLAELAISIIPLFALFLRLRFEAARWKESSFNPYAAVTTSSDDDDDDNDE